MGLSNKTFDVGARFVLFVALFVALTGCAKMQTYLEKIKSKGPETEAVTEDKAVQLFDIRKGIETLEAKQERAEERLRRFEDERKRGAEKAKRRATKRVKEQVKPAEDYREKVRGASEQVSCLWDAVCRKGLTAPQEARLKKAWGEKFRQRMDEVRIEFP